jgi:hypothetical protein
VNISGRQRRAVLHDRAAADREVALAHRRAVSESSRELECIRMRREELAATKSQVTLGIERKVDGSAQLQPARGANAFDDARNLVGIDALRAIAGQPEQDRDVRRVAFAGQRKRSIQIALDASYLASALARRACEFAGGTHRTDRMRTRRTDPDREQLDDTDGTTCRFVCWRFRHDATKICGDSLIVRLSHMTFEPNV